MALIKCPECNKEISDTARKCIHCGYEIKNKKHSIASYLVPLIILFSVFLIGLYIVSSLSNKHAFGLTINEAYGENVEYSCRKYMKNTNDNKKYLYNCTVNEEYRSKNICLECTSDSFIFFSHVSECKIMSEHNCAFIKAGLYN